MSNIKQVVLSALCTAFIIIGSYIIIPMGVVPVVLGNMFVILAGLILGPVWGLASVGAYLLLGALGLPVFAGGKGGFVTIVGPTGGYLVGYLGAVFLTGTVSTKKYFGKYSDLVAVVTGFAVIFLIGLPWLKINLGFSWMKTLSIGLFPFIPGALIKAVAALLLVKAIRPVLEKLNINNA